MLKRILLAVQFHTVLPVKISSGVSEKDMAGSVPFFPLAGAAQGFLLALPAIVFAHFFDRHTAGALALAVYIIASGGFDLDGLADTVDALSVKSCGDPEADREKRLQIMKDSHVGAMGAIAITVSILLKFVLVSGLIGMAGHLAGWAAFALLFMMPAFSKWATVPAMFHGKPARKDGLGRIFIGTTGAGDVAFASFLLACLYLTVFGLLSLAHGGPALNASRVYMFLFLIAFLYAAVRAALRVLTRNFGGLTGDHLGAITEAAEIAFLITALLWLRLLPSMSGL